MDVLQGLPVRAEVDQSLVEEGSSGGGGPGRRRNGFGLPRREGRIGEHNQALREGNRSDLQGAAVSRRAQSAGKGLVRKGSSEQFIGKKRNRVQSSEETERCGARETN